MGKYSHILPKLPKWDGGEDQDYQKKVVAVKNLLKEDTENFECTPVGLAAAVVSARQTREQAEADLYQANLILEAISQMLVEQWEAADVDTMKIAGMHVYTQPEPYTTVQDPQKFRQWCVKNGLEEKLSLPWQTRNAVTKDLLLEGQPEPDGVKTYNRTKVIVKKA